MNTFLSETRFRVQATKVLWITFSWLCVSIMQFLLTYAATIQLKLDTSGLSPFEILRTSMVTGLVAGIVGGTTMVVFWERWLRSKAYSTSLLYILGTYTVIYLLVASIGSIIFQMQQLDQSFLHPAVRQAFLEDATSVAQVTVYVFWLIVVALTLIALQINDKYGPGVFGSFLLGKYFHPKREERIFMFLDLRGSTTIAEKLGESAYFNFLKDLFRDITPGILDSKGEIYQYVGDEVVISWKNTVGAAKANCIQCYLNIQQILVQKSSYYQEKYHGIVPEFKAGLHSGYVMVGEIGIVKREIAYSGDVLNTTARIQSKCNELGVNILLSKNLKQRLNLPKSMDIIPIGELPLRGKQEAVMLYTL